ncbi:MAG TPA: Flp pilus assembly protein CpaB [Planctomycetaceae bacterium]|nr:Flp pilus assembly protein CpaB [Planctomycetaceae bacterium]
MKLKSVLLLAVALVCGLVAMLGVQQALSSNQTDSSDDGFGMVLVAVAEIPPGTPLTDDNVKFERWPKETIPPGAVTKPEEYQQRALKVRTFPGEIIMKAKLGAKGEFGAAADIPEGMRVISVPVDSTMTNSGLIWPGCRVDVFVTYKSVDRRIGTEIATVLEDVEVFAIDNNRDVADQDPSEIKAKTISLLVTPEEAMRLKRAEEMGHLHVAMRGTGDRSRVHAALRFDDVNRAFRHMDAAESQPAAEDGGATTGGLLSFLSQHAGGPADQDGSDQDEVVKPTWKIHIYTASGERVEEVALPESELPAQASATVSSPQPVTNPFLGYLKRVLKAP